MLTASEIGLVRGSFAQVAPISDQAAQMFYGRLFEIAPEVRPLFKGDMTEQGRKLMATLAYVVDGLDRLEQIVPAAESLALRHVGYGVEPAHYARVGEALLWTMAQGLGPAFTSGTQAAWSKAYQGLASVMIAKGYPASVGGPA